MYTIHNLILSVLIVQYKMYIIILSDFCSIQKDDAIYVLMHLLVPMFLCQSFIFLDSVRKDYMRNNYLII